ncbi:MAG: hypothetical protein KAU20_03870 [Nanoarchaeota archaeon]|nr:hypothetical protein [Nanoarchaeota archaeon]
MFKWERWMKDKEQCKDAFEQYLEGETIKKEEEKENLTKSHLKKADYNLDFINNLLKQKKFFDWVIVGCYYAIYHSSLALLSIKGYSSKNHLATLCSLIYLYYKEQESLNDSEKNPGESSQKEDNLNKEDIELVAKSSLDKEDVTYFVEAKNKRETASYSVSEEFSKSESEKLKVKTIIFVNKVKEILEGN